ncbi:two pore domain potassium channel family protein [Sphingomonas rhizophila]|uniref:Two pore domain potassium channel family protein n=1 Tax=Sphingomonas rhizophila TaxID=2071607 RepID=A0A7G9SAE6_9SPHN|nr:ion channel [Sphingomonas rhizophila]QNN64821.1 two pore domain potassium channel family protein [Sphingomonas rhizophila]
MANQLIVALLMVMLTALIHGAGLLGMGRALGIERNLETRVCVDFSTLRGMLIELGLVLAIFALHFLQISLYALLYYVVGALPTAAKSLYFSMITYGTIGYDDQDMVGTYQLVAAVEGINGILLLGWSTAFLVTTVSRISRHGG